MKDEELENDIDYLLKNQGMTMVSKYHDTYSCWLLIEGLLNRLKPVIKADILINGQKEGL